MPLLPSVIDFCFLRLAKVLHTCSAILLVHYPTTSFLQSLYLKKLTNGALSQIQLDFEIDINAFFKVDMT